MKKDIHPNYYKEAVITCSCGAVLTVGATQESMQTEICSQCHPFYTGKKKVVDTTGRVDRFKKLSQKASEKREQVKKAKEAKAKRKEEKSKKEAKEESKKK